MSLVGRVFEQRSSLENPSTDLREALGGYSVAGVSVTPTSAMGVTAVWSSVRLLAGTMRSLPVDVLYKSSRLPAEGTALHNILTVQANPEMPSAELIEITTAHLSLFGNAFWFKERDANGLVTALWPIHPQKIAVGRANGKRVYRLSNGSTQHVGTDRDFLHIRGLSVDGLVGLSPVTAQRQALGLQLAQQDYVSHFYANNASPGGILTTPALLSDEAAERLAASWAASQGGLKNAAKTAVLEEGTTWQSTSISLEDQQFLEARRFGVSEVARIFNIPPSMLGGEDGGSLTYANVAERYRDYLRSAIMPIASRIETAIAWDGDLTPGVDLVAKFDMDEMTRPDQKTRFETLKTGIDAGFIDREDARQSEGLAPKASQTALPGEE